MLMLMFSDREGIASQLPKETEGFGKSALQSYKKQVVGGEGTTQLVDDRIPSSLGQRC